MIRDVITIKRPTLTGTAYSGSATGWANPVNVATVWAEIEAQPAGSTEGMDTAKVNSMQTWQIKIRHRTDVRTSYRVFWKSQVFEIQNIRPGTIRNKVLFLDCIEREA